MHQFQLLQILKDCKIFKFFFIKIKYFFFRKSNLNLSDKALATYSGDNEPEEENEDDESIPTGEIDDDEVETDVDSIEKLNNQEISKINEIELNDFIKQVKII